MSTATPTSHPIRWYASVAVVLFIFVVIAIQASRVAQDTTTYDEEQGRIRTEKLEKLQAADQKTLTTADWVDKDKGIVRIPIDEAMSQEVAVLKAKPVAVGSEIPGAVAAPAPAPTNAAPASGGTPPASTNAAPTTPQPTK